MGPQVGRSCGWALPPGLRVEVGLGLGHSGGKREGTGDGLWDREPWGLPLGLREGPAGLAGEHEGRLRAATWIWAIISTSRLTSWRREGRFPEQPSQLWERQEALEEAEEEEMSRGDGSSPSSCSSSGRESGSGTSI